MLLGGAGEAWKALLGGVALIFAWSGLEEVVILLFADEGLRLWNSDSCWDALALIGSAQFALDSGTRGLQKLANGKSSYLWKVNVVDGASTSTLSGGCCGGRGSGGTGGGGWCWSGGCWRSGDWATSLLWAHISLLIENQVVALWAS